jgi:hypothetical protein
VTGGSKRLARQYSPNFGTDQLENGNPRSCGLDKATSIQLAQLLGTEDWRPTFGIGYLLKGRESALVETMYPIVGHCKMTADTVRCLGQGMPPVHLLDNSIPLMDAR